MNFTCTVLWTKRTWRLPPGKCRWARWWCATAGSPVSPEPCVAYECSGAPIETCRVPEAAHALVGFDGRFDLIDYLWRRFSE